MNDSRTVFVVTYVADPYIGAPFIGVYGTREQADAEVRRQCAIHPHLSKVTDYGVDEHEVTW